MPSNAAHELLGYSLWEVVQEEGSHWRRMSFQGRYRLFAGLKVPQAESSLRIHLIREV